MCVFRWNQLDIAIVALSIMGITLEELKMSAALPINPTIIRIMRVLRIARGRNTHRHINHNCLSSKLLLHHRLHHKCIYLCCEALFITIFFIVYSCKLKVRSEVCHGCLVASRNKQCLLAVVAVLVSCHAFVNPAANGQQQQLAKTTSVSLCSAETSKDGHGDEISAGYCHASAATGKHRLWGLKTQERFCFIHDFFFHEYRVNRKVLFRIDSSLKDLCLLMNI